MKKILFIPFIIISTISSAQNSQSWSGNCGIRFSGNSTLHSFSGTVSAEPFTIQIANSGDPAHAVAKGRITAKAAKMDTEKPARDRKMHKVMGTSSFPDVIVDIGTLTAAATKPKPGGAVPEPTVIPFNLTIKDKTRKMAGRVSKWSYSDGKISFHVGFPVSLRSFGIQPPSVAGIVKVDDTIQVEAAVHLQRK